MALRGGGIRPKCKPGCSSGSTVDRGENLLDSAKLKDKITRSHGSCLWQVYLCLAPSLLAGRSSYNRHSFPQCYCHALSSLHRVFTKCSERAASTLDLPAWYALGFISIIYMSRQFIIIAYLQEADSKTTSLITESMTGLCVNYKMFKFYLKRFPFGDTIPQHTALNGIRCCE
jgi:hypothetical protein